MRFWLLSVATGPQGDRTAYPCHTHFVTQQESWPFAIVDRSMSGPGSVLMIVSDRDEAQDIADEMRRDHFDIGIVEVKNEQQVRSSPER